LERRAQASLETTSEEISPMTVVRMLSLALCASTCTLAHAGFLLEIDTDGADDAVLTLNPGFAFGGDTTTASQSVSASAFGTTGGDSIAGGDGSMFPDTYVYTYSPDAQADNLVIPAGVDLGQGNLGTGVVGGAPGTYRVYALWPQSSNVGGGLTNYEVSTGGDSFQISLDQNLLGDAWVLLGEIEYTSGAITVTQTSTINSFVSMRAYGMLFEAVPTPSGATVLGLAALGFARRRR
jgi:hypothetical protein